MAINVKKFELDLKRTLPNLDFEVQLEGSTTVLKTQVEIDVHFDDYILLDFYVDKEGFILINFIFGRLARNLEVYKLINDFNENCNFKGYIAKENNDQFELEVLNFNIRSNKEALKFAEFYLYDLISDKNLNYLKPILEHSIE